MNSIIKQCIDYCKQENMTYITCYESMDTNYEKYKDIIIEAIKDGDSKLIQCFYAANQLTPKEVYCFNKKAEFFNEGE